MTENTSIARYQSGDGDLATFTDAPNVEHILAGQLAASSIAMYKRDMAAYLDYATEHSLHWQDPHTLIAWRDDLALTSEMSPNTINRMIAAVKRIARELAARSLLEETIALKFDRIRGVQVKALKQRLKKHSRTRITPQDMRLLCDAPDTSSAIGRRDAALLAVLASSGIRASEAATLTLEQVEKRGRGYCLRVCGKTDTEYRDAHLSPEAYRRINEWIQCRKVESQYIFTSFSTRGTIPSPEPISEVSVWKVVKRYASQCGLQHVKPHDLRRFVGTELTKVDIRKAQKALGHKSIEVTARHYVLDELEIGLTDDLY
jgi:integrase/recombinase XerD